MALANAKKNRFKRFSVMDCMITHPIKEMDENDDNNHNDCINHGNFGLGYNINVIDNKDDIDIDSAPKFLNVDMPSNQNSSLQNSKTATNEFNLRESSDLQNTDNNTFSFNKVACGTKLYGTNEISHTSLIDGSNNESSPSKKRTSLMSLNQRDKQLKGKLESTDRCLLVEDNTNQNNSQKEIDSPITMKNNNFYTNPNMRTTQSYLKRDSSSTYNPNSCETFFKIDMKESNNNDDRQVATAQFLGSPVISQDDNQRNLSVIYSKRQLEQVEVNVDSEEDISESEENYDRYYLKPSGLNKEIKSKTYVSTLQELKKSSQNSIVIKTSPKKFDSSNV